jgi:tetratricopeptide (TPR) repeat protein
MLLHEARRATRTRDGVLVTLENQDRSRWDRALIAEGVATLDEALGMGRSGPYQVQAAIAACHAGAPDAARTDWPQIAALYAQLARLAPSPVVDLNRAVAVAMVDGLPAGLRLVDELAASGRLEGYHLLPATRADLLRRDGRVAEARAAYEEALAIAREIGDRRGEGNALGNLGNAYADLGETGRAIQFFEQRLTIAREIGDRRGEGAALWNMSLALDQLGERTQAIHHAEQALTIYEQIEDPYAAKVREQLAAWREQTNT